MLSNSVVRFAVIGLRWERNAIWVHIYPQICTAQLACIIHSKSRNIHTSSFAYNIWLKSFLTLAVCAAKSSKCPKLIYPIFISHDNDRNHKEPQMKMKWVKRKVLRRHAIYVSPRFRSNFHLCLVNGVRVGIIIGLAVSICIWEMLSKSCLQFTRTIPTCIYSIP